MQARSRTTDLFYVQPGWSEKLRDAGITSPEDIFRSPRIRVWRQLDGRENATLDLPGQARLHVKRYLTPGPHSVLSPAEAEFHAWQLLQHERIPCMEIAACGRTHDGRSFLMAVDLAGYESGQVLLRRGVPFSFVAGPTAHLAARLHTAGLHHQDLYLCHFFLTSPGVTQTVDCRLIDVARVRPLPRLLFRTRWIVKDLAQFWYSASGEFSVDEAQLSAWLEDYAAHRGIRAGSLRGAVLRKVARIARHDRTLKARQPSRNISLPTGPGQPEGAS